VEMFQMTPATRRPTYHTDVYQPGAARNWVAGQLSKRGGERDYSRRSRRGTRGMEFGEWHL
jgi:hypothetical protein